MLLKTRNMSTFGVRKIGTARYDSEIISYLGFTMRLLLKELNVQRIKTFSNQKFTFQSLISACNSCVKYTSCILVLPNMSSFVYTFMNL